MSRGQEIIDNNSLFRNNGFILDVVLVTLLSQLFDFHILLLNTMKNEKKPFDGFSYSKNVVNHELLSMVISSSINAIFLKSVLFLE